MTNKVLYRVNQNKITGECQIERLEVWPTYNFDGVVDDGFNRNMIEVQSTKTGEVFRINKLQIGKNIFESELAAKKECDRLKSIFNTWKSEQHNDFIERMMENISEANKSDKQVTDSKTEDTTSHSEDTFDIKKYLSELDTADDVLEKLKEYITESDKDYITVGDKIKIKLQTVEFLLNLVSEDYENL